MLHEVCILGAHKRVKRVCGVLCNRLVCTQDPGIEAVTQDALSGNLRSVDTSVVEDFLIMHTNNSHV